MRVRAIVAIAGWTVLFLGLIDFATGLAFRFPSDARAAATDAQAYFEYGRSLEGKLDRMLGADDASAAPIAFAGWVDRDCRRPIPAAADGKLGVTFYGMSFTNHVATALEAIDPAVTAVTRSGPAASLNHSYACFDAIDRAGGDADRVQVIGILASSVYRMLSMSGLTTAFEVPTPYTYPRYRLSSTGSITSDEPIVRQPADWRDTTMRTAFIQQLEADDAFFDRRLMKGGWSDASVIARMVRRAYAQHRLAARQQALVGDADRFVDQPDLGPVMLALLQDFARRTRQRGGLPIVILIQDRPGVDALDRFLGPALAAAGIATISTHDIVPTTDPANFTSDGHFTAAADRRVAERLRASIASELKPAR